MPLRFHKKELDSGLVPIQNNIYQYNLGSGSLGPFSLHCEDTYMTTSNQATSYMGLVLHLQFPNRHHRNLATDTTC